MSDNLLKIVQVSYNEYAHRYIPLFFFLIIITVLSYKGIFRVFNFITLAYVYKYYKNDQMTISYLPYLVCKIRLSLLNHNLKSTFLLPETNTGSTCKLSAPIKCKKNIIVLSNSQKYQRKRKSCPLQVHIVIYNQCK